MAGFRFRTTTTSVMMRETRCTCLPSQAKKELVLLSLWESLEAIQKFSRGEFEKEVSYPADKVFLLEFDSKVTHYKALIQP